MEALPVSGREIGEFGFVNGGRVDGVSRAPCEPVGIVTVDRLLSLGCHRQTSEFLP